MKMSFWAALNLHTVFYKKTSVILTNAKNMCNFEVRRKNRNIIFIENDRVEKHKEAS